MYNATKAIGHPHLLSEPAHLKQLYHWHFLHIGEGEVQHYKARSPEEGLDHIRQKRGGCPHAARKKGVKRTYRLDEEGSRANIEASEGYLGQQPADGGWNSEVRPARPLESR